MERRSLCVLLVALIGAADGLLLGGALAPPVAARSAASGARRLITTTGTGAISMAAAEEKEISDAETVLRWVGVQGTVDLSIILAFAYHYNFSWETAVSQPELKFLILMPAVTVFFQILRRFGSEELPNSQIPFEDDPIVKYLGGATKVRELRGRWLEIVTIKAK